MQNSLLYKKKIWRGAPQRSKTRPRANRRGTLSQIEGPDFLYSKEPFPFSKAEILSQKLGLLRITRRATCLDVTSLITFGLELCENHEPNPDLNPGFQKIIIPVCRHSSHAQSASRKSRTLCQKARNGNCSSITGCRQIVQE